MNSITDVWNSILDILRQSVTETAMNTWFADCAPVELRDGRLTVCVPNDFKRGIINERFAESIRGALRELFSGNFELQILTKDELEEMEGEDGGESDPLPIVAGYTFDRYAGLCKGTVPFALEAFLESADFEDCIRNTVSIGGDTDSLGAVSGAIAEAYYGTPHPFLPAVREKLTPDLLAVLDKLDSLDWPPETAGRPQ